MSPLGHGMVTELVASTNSEQDVLPGIDTNLDIHTARRCNPLPDTTLSMVLHFARSLRRKRARRFLWNHRPVDRRFD